MVYNRIINNIPTLLKKCQKITECIYQIIIKSFMGHLFFQSIKEMIKCFLNCFLRLNHECGSINWYKPCGLRPDIFIFFLFKGGYWVRFFSFRSFIVRELPFRSCFFQSLKIFFLEKFVRSVKKTIFFFEII